MGKHTRKIAFSGLATITLAALSVAALQPQAAQAADVTKPSHNVLELEPGSPYRITWKDSCGGWKEDPTMKCGHLIAPLDYTDPDKGTVKLKLKMRLADDQEAKQGVIFGNPGGPGASGSRYTEFFANLVGEKTRKHFDIVGLDPRGLPGSQPRFHCGRDSGSDVPIFPLDADSYVNTQESNARFRQACVDRENEIGKYMSTADLARDIELANRILGQERINFLGFSYGTHVAATLNNMFGHKMRTVAAISAIDPVQWSSGYGVDGVRTPAFQRVGSAKGSARGWAAAIDECEQAGVEKCAVAETIRADWDLVHTKGRDGVYKFRWKTLTYDKLGRELASAAYSRYSVYTGLLMIGSVADQIRGEKTDPKSLNRVEAQLAKPYLNMGLTVPHEDLVDSLPTDSPTRKNREHPDTTAGLGSAFAWNAQSMVAIICGETLNPFDPSQIGGAHARNRAILPGEGEFRTWQGAACANWKLKAPNAYHGPYDKSSQATMFIIQNEFDNATPYLEGGLKLHEMTPDSRMLLVKGGYGHAPYKYRDCMGTHLEDYFMTAKAPAEDIQCTPKASLFDY